MRRSIKEDSELLEIKKLVDNYDIGVYNLVKPLTSIFRSYDVTKRKDSIVLEDTKGKTIIITNSMNLDEIEYEGSKVLAQNGSLTIGYGKISEKVKRYEESLITEEIQVNKDILMKIEDKDKDRYLESFSINFFVDEAVRTFKDWFQVDFEDEYFLGNYSTKKYLITTFIGFCFNKYENSVEDDFINKNIEKIIALVIKKVDQTYD